MNPKIVWFGFFFYFVFSSDKKGKNNLKYDFWIYKFNKINNINNNNINSYLFRIKAAAIYDKYFSNKSF